jgi:hypothetical protein
VTPPSPSRPSDAEEASPQSYASSVTSSRAGDRFHYVWAAVQSLQLLDSRSGLVEVWIEGVAGDPIPGDEIIDLAEYYGPPTGPIDRVLVRQLKYSTQRAHANLGLGELGTTLRKFAQVDAGRDTGLQIPAEASARYSVTSNRPVAPTLRSAIAKIISGQNFAPNSYPAKVLGWLQLDRDAASELLRRVDFDGAGTSLAALRAELDALTADLSGEPISTVPAVLIEQISKRASGEASGPIDLPLVAMVFGTTAGDLLPAPPLIQRPSRLITRAVYQDLADQIMAAGTATIISAVGGAGKSTFAAALPDLLENRAVVVVYDCFGNGSYRSASKPRHRHRDGIVQIASELASQALCPPILARSGTESAELLRALERRLKDARDRAQALTPGIELVVVVDAADNAVIAADANGDRTFATDLLRIDSIPGVHFVLTARPYRIPSLNPPPALEPLALPEFSKEESAALLRSVFPDAIDDEAAEFHLRTSGNPRVEALALESGSTIGECLAALTGVAPEGSDAVEQFLNGKLGRILDDAGSDRKSLEFVAQLLATLRPRIPISVLARLAAVDSTLIRSFASDIGRGLLVEDDAVQFLDEPTETYFRTRFHLNEANADPVIAQLRTLAETNAYAAASLPQVLWEAGRFQDLADLALSDDALPDDGEVARRQIAQLRASFALRAAIRQRDPVAIAHLAMVAGAAAASSERRYTLLRDHPHLTGEVLPASTLDQIRAARLFPEAWPGSVLSAEAVMLATAGRDADALNRLRAAVATSTAWYQLPSEKRPGRMEPRHGGDIALARTFLLGEADAARFLDAWHPDSWALQQAQLVAAVLLSRGEAERVSRLGTASRTKAVTLAIAAEAQRVGVSLSREHAERAWQNLRGPRVEIDHDDFSSMEVSDDVYRGAAWVAAHTVRAGIATPKQAANFLTKYVPANPPHGLGDARGRDSNGLLCAYALRAHLTGRALTVPDLKPPPASRGALMTDAERGELSRLIPWLEKWARWAVAAADDDDDDSTLALLVEFPGSRSSYRDPILLRRIAGPMAAQFARTSRSSDVVARFRELMRTANDHSGLFVAADMIASLQGDARFVTEAYVAAAAGAVSAEAERQSADQTADDLVRIARAVYAYAPAEAHEYFGRALAIVSRIGNDAWQRWEALTALAGAASVDDADEAFLLAAHIARALEELEPYLYNGVDTRKLVGALQHLAGPRSLAIFSRWQDARFGYFSGMLGEFVDRTAGVLEGHPVLRIALCPLTPSVRVGGELRTLETAGALTDAAFNAARDLVRAAGEDLSAEDVGPALAARFDLPSSRPRPDDERVVSSFDTSDFQEEQERKREELRKILHDLPLGTTEGMAAAAAAVRAGPMEAINSLVDEIAERAVHTWAAILDAFGAEDAVSPWDRAAFMRAVAEFELPSQAFRAARKRLAENYLGRHASDVATASSLGADRKLLAEMLQTDESCVLTTALGLVDTEVVVATADACYRLASTVASLLTPDAARQALERALAALESVLQAEPWTSADVEIPDTVTPEESVVAALWSALADARAAIRWRATHAVRYLILTGNDPTIEALAATVVGDAPAGFTDPRFVFYRLYAVEGFLSAAERAAIEDPTRVAPMLLAIATLQAAHPDHLRIQGICHRIGVRCGDPTLAAAADIVRLPTEPLRRWDRPSAPSPMGHDAVTSELSFSPDFEEYAVAPLSESFEVSHEEVVHAMSDLVLGEWGYRRDELRRNDARRVAGAYEREETHFYKSHFPRADDLEYYLSNQALLTVAGRLARTRPGYHDPEDKTDAVDEWFRRYDLARADRRWLADARRPVPVDQQRPQHDYSGAWVWRVSAADFLQGFLAKDGWVTVGLSALQSESRSWDNTFISTALVFPETAPALMRSLQWAPSFHNHRLPVTGDEDFTFDSGPFQLRQWIDNPNGASGADSRDEYARDIHYPTPRPSQWVRDLLNLSATDDGLRWLRDGEVVAYSLSWSADDIGRERHGPSGSLLRVAPSLLSDLAEATGMSVIAEVRFDRFDETHQDLMKSDDSMGYIDDYVRFFLFTPGDGWRDSSGRPVSG